jgi:hypothetical protein
MRGNIRLNKGDSKKGMIGVFFGKKTDKKRWLSCTIKFLEDVEANAENEPKKLIKKGCTIEEVRGQYIQASSPKQLLQNVISGIFPSSTYRV